MIKQENIDISAVHADCGLILFDLAKQKDVGAGGSGCGCSGAVLCTEILPKIESGELKKVLFVGTGCSFSLLIMNLLGVQMCFRALMDAKKTAPK